ncbi:hypothetical protein EXIGLDRAFT_829295 [Exidia glandulosa HHB12029]|uniref:Mid2 domain-containing protein n=1 Tax=Exidia glandulosa HHB12029 TaxID=1314781 RepID=A0A165PN20_EXIGL|nr:hypothetical protein EXIGLDRAFT_829295 [Exidia glandulosa HHB12029]
MERGLGARAALLFRLFLFLFAFIPSHFVMAAVPYQPLSFNFDYQPPGSTFRVPTTEQCETLHLTWGRNGPDGSPATGLVTGPDPVFPAFLRIYTPITNKTLVLQAGNGPENVFDFMLPLDFRPGTVYQICMVDSIGNSGGCQEQYTVIPSSNATLPAECVPAQFAEHTLDVSFTAGSSPGKASTIGFFDQCSSLHVTPLEGTPPYTLTIAPSLVPPINITSDKRETLSWQISLSWGANFWISMSDATGMSWSAGPMHSGGPGHTECLTQTKMFTKREIAGASVGSLFAGLLLALVPLLFLLASKRRRARISVLVRPSTLDPRLEGPVTPYYATTPSFPQLQAPAQTHVDADSGPTLPRGPPTRTDSTTTTTSNWHTFEKSLPSVPPEPAVYVVHQDGGRVAITQRVPEIVDLPPMYRDANTANSFVLPIGEFDKDDTVSVVSSPKSLSAHPLVPKSTTSASGEATLAD